MPTELNSPPTDRRLSSCLMGVILGLLLVGLVSCTPLRHVVQVLPACIVLIVLRRRASWALYAAATIFAFWLIVMTLIWLFLLGLTDVLRGEFSTAEVILTLFIGVWCILGLFNFSRIAMSASMIARIVASLSATILQVAALWASMQTYISHR